MKSAGGANAEDTQAELQVTFNDDSGDTMSDNALGTFQLECYNKQKKAENDVQDVDDPAASATTTVVQFVPATVVPSSYMEHGYYCFKYFVIKAEKQDFTKHFTAERNFVLRYTFPREVVKVSRADSKLMQRMEKSEKRSNVADVDHARDRIQKEMNTELAGFHFMQKSMQNALDDLMTCLRDPQTYGVDEQEKEALIQQRKQIMRDMAVHREDHAAKKKTINDALVNLPVPFTAQSKRIKMEPCATPKRVEKSFMPVLSEQPSACSGSAAGSATAATAATAAMATADT
jgi:hypothetical protein